MVLEVGRRFVNGAWVTDVQDESGGGGAVTAADIDSEAAGNGEVLTADGAGGASWEAAGGSLPGIKVVRVPLAFDTPDLVVTGIDAYTPVAGETIMWGMSFVSVATVWDANSVGTGVSLSFTWSDYASAWNSQDLTVADALSGDGHAMQPVTNPGAGLGFNVYPGICPDATPVRVIVTDAAGADPESTQGEGEVVLFVVTVAA